MPSAESEEPTSVNELQNLPDRHVSQVVKLPTEENLPAAHAVASKYSKAIVVFQPANPKNQLPEATGIVAIITAALGIVSNQTLRFCVLAMYTNW